jgi:hypothetical protein
MITLIVTYIVAWAAISAYSARLAIGSRKLKVRLDRLESDHDAKLPGLTSAKPAA